MAENLLLETVDLSALQGLSRNHYLSSLVSSIIAALDPASDAQALGYSGSIRNVKVLTIGGQASGMFAVSPAPPPLSTVSAQDTDAQTSECSLLTELQIIASPDGDCAVFHPPTLTLFRTNALTAAVLKGCRNGASLAALSEEYGISEDDISLLIARLKQTLDTCPPVEIVQETLEHLQKLVLNVSGTCNMRCRYCYADGGSYGRDVSRMSPEVACQAIEQVSEHCEVGTVMFFGGEPTLNPEAIKVSCERLIELCDEGRINHLPLWGLVTNGLALSQYMEDLIRRYKLVITVSLDGPPGINDGLRPTRGGAGTFQRVATSIRRIQEITDGAEPSKIEVTYTGAHRQAGWSMLALIDYFEREFGIRNIHIAPVTVKPGHDLFWNPAENVDILRETVLGLFDSWRAGSHRQTQLVTRYMHTMLTHTASSYLCGAGLNELTVFPNGDVHPCYMFPDDEFRMGNVADARLFHGERFQAVQRRFRSNAKDSLARCSQCWIKGFCRVCLRAPYAASRTIDQIPEHVCVLNQAVVEAVLLTLTRMNADADVWKALCQNMTQMLSQNLAKHMRYWI